MTQGPLCHRAARQPGRELMEPALRHQLHTSPRSNASGREHHVRPVTSSLRVRQHLAHLPGGCVSKLASALGVGGDVKPDHHQPF